MRRRDFTMGLLLAGAAGTVRAQEPAKQHRIAIVLTVGPVTRIDDPPNRAWQAFWEELRRLGDVEGPNLTVERYSGEGRPAGYDDLAREVVNRGPDVIVVGGPALARGHRYNTDRFDRGRADPARTRGELGASGRQRHRRYQ